MSTPSIRVGQGNWGIKAGNLLGYANTEKKFVAREFAVGRLLNTATRVNASGDIEGVNANVPRIDYFGGQASLLVEPSAQNLVLQSQAFDVTWTPLIGGTGVNPAITTNAVISPDGTQNAERIVFNRGAGNALVDQSTLQQNITIPTTGPYIFSVYAKASTAGDVGKQVFLRIGGAGALTAITLTANWVRYSQAETSVSSGSQTVQIGNRGTVTADNSVSVDLWGAQAEGGAIPTSYIPTTTGSVTRSADAISLTGVAGLIGQTEGTLYSEAVYSSIASTKTLVAINDGTVDNRIALRIVSTTLISATVVVTGTSYTISATIPAIPSSGLVKMALGYKADDYALVINGAIYPFTTTRPVPPTTAVFLGNNGFNADFLNDRIRAAALYTTRLPNVAPPGVLSLQSLTAI